MFRAVGDRTMEAWSLHMLGTALLRNGDVAEARENVTHAIRHFHAAGDASGLTLTLDDLSAVAVADGDLPRAARLRGAARNLTPRRAPSWPGTSRRRSSAAPARASGRRCPADDLARYGAEGAALTLDEAVAYALEGADPAVHDDDPGVG